MSRIESAVRRAPTETGLWCPVAEGDVLYPLHVSVSGRGRARRWMLCDEEPRAWLDAAALAERFGGCKWVHLEDALAVFPSSRVTWTRERTRRG